jgi:putative DNA primase/helicase
MRFLWRDGEFGYLWRLSDKRAHWLSVGALDGEIDILGPGWEQDVFFGVHPTRTLRTGYERGRAGDVVAANCLFADFDDPDALQRIESLQPAPQVIVASGRGFHAYWLLAEPVILSDDAARRDWAEIQRWWVRHVGADPSACDLARVLRVPGTRNGKYDPPRPVQYVRCELDQPHDNQELMRYILDARTAELEREQVQAAQQERAPARPSAGAGESPIERYNRETNIRDALRQFGYTLVGTRYFVRPGKDPRDGISGTIDDANNRAYTFSSNDPAYDPANTSPSGVGCTLRSFDLLCRLSFGGDAKAAVRWLTQSAKGGRPGPAQNGSAPPAEALPPAAVEALRAAEGQGKLGYDGDGEDGLEGALVDEARRLPFQPDPGPITTTETGAAMLLVQNFHDRLRYTNGRGWMRWDGARWTPEGGEDLARHCARVIGAYFVLRALDMPSDKSRSRDKMMTVAHRILKANGVDGVLREARSMPPIAAKDSDFDADPWLLNCPNGVVDLRTGKLKPHKEGETAPFTRVTGVNYIEPEEPEQAAPLWRKTLHEVFDGDEEIIGFFRRWSGYRLTGIMTEQRYVVAYGSGANGKSTLFTVQSFVLGDYSRHVSTAALTLRSGVDTNSEIAQLPGVRDVIVPEWDESRRVDEILLKAITGEDPVTTRQLYRSAFTFKPQCKITILGNSKPKLRARDEGTWRRPICLPFTRTFTSSQADPELKEKLKAEGSEILWWMVQGCLEWQREGLRVPAALEAAKRQWRGEADDVLCFLGECCQENPRGRVRVGELHQAYRRWGGAIETVHAFGRALRELRMEVEQSGKRYYLVGFELHEEARKQFLGQGC